MKAFVGPLVLVLALLFAGEGLRRASAIEDTLATAEEQLTTVGAASRATENSLDEAIAVAADLPVLGTQLSAEVRRNRATQAYWQKDYAAVVSGPFAPAANDADATLLLLSANASFRQAVAREKTAATLARGLDDVLKGYATVLDRDPGNRDAAYNYEFVSRLRGALAGGRTSGAAEPEARSIQGEQGEPPQGTRKSDFNVIVPLRPEERQEQLDPGGGAEFKRKG